jgi:hypothetical protein
VAGLWWLVEGLAGELLWDKRVAGGWVGWGVVLLWLAAGEQGVSLQLLLAMFLGSRRQRMKQGDVTL